MRSPWLERSADKRKALVCCVYSHQTARAGGGGERELSRSHVRTYGHTHTRSRARVHTHASVSQQHVSVSQGRICSDNFTCCHTETEVADQTFYLTQSQYTETGPTSPSADPFTPGAWQGSHWSANFLSHWYDSTPEKPQRKRDSNPRSSALEIHSRVAGTLSNQQTTNPLHYGFQRH